MNWKLSLLAVGAVLLASCLGERREAPAERCGELPAASCRDALLVGPGTFPLDTADARVFDVPAGARVQARLVYLGEGVYRASAGRSELARYGLTDSGHFLDSDEWILIQDVATGSELRISTLSAEELDRTIIRNRMIVLDYDEGSVSPGSGTSSSTGASSTRARASRRIGSGPYRLRMRCTLATPSMHCSTRSLNRSAKQIPDRE